jgi:uncharacterized damage-inducible protein DinB
MIGAFVDLLSSYAEGRNDAGTRQMNIFLNMIDHALWADAQVVAAIGSIAVARAERAEATRLYAHVAGAEHIWLSRLKGRRPEHPVWPELSLDDAAALAAASLAELRVIADAPPEALDRDVEYQTSTGQVFRSTAAEILSQVALHGSYHRGQIALLTRQGGGAPVATDYIVYARR